jgi:hypothetical protein
MMTTYQQFLTRVIDSGIQAARKDYGGQGDAHKLKGALAGFEVCRGKVPEEIRKLLCAARLKRFELSRSQAGSSSYWEHVCYEAEIEWVANVVSAALVSSGENTIISPTCMGVLQAAKLLESAGQTS